MFSSAASESLARRAQATAQDPVFQKLKGQFTTGKCLNCFIKCYLVPREIPLLLPSSEFNCEGILLFCFSSIFPERERRIEHLSVIHQT